MVYFGKLSYYYKNEGGIKAIFKFLAPIMRVKYTFENKEDEITLDINKKEVGLKNILANIDKSLKEMFFWDKRRYERDKKRS